MIKVGITGGIGSGKTYVCKKFEKLNIKIYYADKRAKELTNSDINIRENLIKNFGKDIYANNKLNKAKLSEIIFNNKKNLNLVNSIIHPVVEKDFEYWCKTNSTEKFILKEAAILFETGTYKKLDKIITVISPLELRLDRIKKRDNISINEIMKKIKNQSDDIDKIKKSDFVIYNDNIINLDKQILEIYKILKK